MAWNCALGTGKVDGKGVVEGLRIRKGGRGDGIKNRPVH